MAADTKKNIMTHEGMQELERELDELKRYLNQDIAAKIKEAREQGDLSENAEYDAAKDEQRDTQARIDELEDILKHAEIVQENEGEVDKVNIGSYVAIQDLDFDETDVFQMVGTIQASYLDKKISNESPLGKALVGAKVGDEVSFDTQDGPAHYKVLGISQKSAEEALAGPAKKAKKAKK